MVYLYVNICLDLRKPYILGPLGCGVMLIRIIQQQRGEGVRPGKEDLVMDRDKFMSSAPLPISLF